MKIINKKNFDKAPKVLYMVQFNLGGLLHDNIYTVYKQDDGHWWDKGGDISIDLKIDNYSIESSLTVIRLDKINCKENGVWQFITEDKSKAELFLLGARTSLCFMNETWLKYYANR